jgi:hypothetical protein
MRLFTLAHFMAKPLFNTINTFPFLRTEEAKISGGE